MFNDHINLARGNIVAAKRRKKPRSLLYKIGRFLLIIIIAIFVILFALSYKVIFSQETFGQTLAKLPVISQIRSLISGNDKIVEDDDRINFLLMGIGGAGHDGALLTDTMMLVSIKVPSKQIAFVSVPRDLLVKIPGNGWQRINHANAYGELNNYEGGGSALAAQTVEETFGVPIDYWMRIDFQGFKEVIDDIGGIDVNVDKEFTDNEYPTDDFKVQTVHFDAGEQKMEGARALIFARSRHGDNFEGSDFARSKRQQKILLAIKDKILSWKTFINPNRLFSLYENAQKNIETNVEAWQLPQFLNLFKDLDFNTIEHYVIDDAPGGLLKSIITEEGAQVLAPKSGDLAELQEFVRNIFVIKEIEEKNLSVIIANGTTIEGLATYMGSTLEAWGFNIARIINSPQQDFEKTVIYSLEGNGNDEALAIIKNRMNANVAKDLPDFLTPLIYRKNDNGQDEKITADFLIVVGLDQKIAIKAIEDWASGQAGLAESASNTGEGAEEK